MFDVFRHFPALMCAFGIMAAAFPNIPAVAAAEVTAARTNLRRLTEEQYRRSIADIFGADIVIAGRFEQERRTAGLLAIDSTSGSFSPSSYEQYDQMARSIAAQVTDKEHRSALISCVPKDVRAADDKCARKFLSNAGMLLYRRPVTIEELETLTALAHSTGDNFKDFYLGVQSALASVLLSPEFLFRMESGIADKAARDGYRMDGYSKATRLAYFLWNSTPDEALLRAAQTGSLDTREGLTEQVNRMLHSPKVLAGTRAFFSDMLGLEGFSSLSKDSVIYPRFDSAVGRDAREELLRLITDQLLTRDGDYRDLFTTRRDFLTRRLGLIYDVPVQNRYGWTEYEFSAQDHRDGVLTRISLLSLYSHPGRSSATLRGKAIRELLLCQNVPPPPPNVNFSLVQDTSNAQFRTARARLAKHSEDSMCASCHKVTDPLGLALENFDSSGEFRTSENGAAIDASGFLGERSFADATGLGQAMHDDPQSAACLVQRSYDYATGRAAPRAERPFLRDLTAGFVADGYRYPALLRRIVLSDQFFGLWSETAPTSAAVVDLKATPH
jgi:Protein of unknown function (DUF1592)/Protein of unknown function (DUF1588)/Protein of unknown function (DUF1595)/Protein of unknown function (DUF1585)/Protein of unknown function (DUF1587)